MSLWPNAWADGAAERLASALAQYDKALHASHAPHRPSALSASCCARGGAGGAGGGAHGTLSLASFATPRFVNPVNPQLLGAAGLFGALPTGLVSPHVSPQLFYCVSAQRAEWAAAGGAPAFATAFAGAGVEPSSAHAMAQPLAHGAPVLAPPHELLAGAHAPLPAEQSAPRWDEPVKCQVCPRVFATKYQAKKHFLRRHFVGEKRYVCTRCDKKSFSVREDLTMHLKACGRMFICSCGLQLRTQATLKRHCKHMAHEPTSWEGVPLAPTAAELQGVQHRDDDGASSSDMESLASSVLSPFTTPEASPYSSPTSVRRFGTSPAKPRLPLLAVAAAKAHEEARAAAAAPAGASHARPAAHAYAPAQPSALGAPAPSAALGALAASKQATAAPTSAALGKGVEEMSADELLDMLSSCL
ncbi:hypothetical protein KFE25_001564 [Diacronema lutheri]|uniref:C2H2-type domain-containing protein n=1 Tax=Diacronema lutheri TaxID=2081491 RepID=A0A8J6C0X2_DIALT|nr:hypothetical protein KFE25_001564 [Diacronema lutheri]